MQTLNLFIFTYGNILPFQSLNVLVFAIYGGCYQIMKYISKATYTDSNQLLDSGLDLNMEGGMGE